MSLTDGHFHGIDGAMYEDRMDKRGKDVASAARLVVSHPMWPLVLALFELEGWQQGDPVGADIISLEKDVQAAADNLHRSGASMGGNI